ncbi:type II toxin-antitoxin system VapC family toxin [Microcystis sp. Msp_OC_L_20101000_S702]|uniref:type II toxin-antitoxin system VapC family toxin n=1 Tax=Microcystis sp. Msp_OC_L_20101000_S702 TaxID=2486218 RepID=UPI00257EDF1B|nr:type II toxin-antitoxin system VapC family toxin [Microcystis sp. Msp_OC_L_20101000_S702]
MIEFVLDCSVAISWCLVDEDNDYANAVLDIMPNAEAFVPEIWSLEIVNTLLVAERRNRMTVEQKIIQ